MWRLIIAFCSMSNWFGLSSWKNPVFFPGPNRFENGNFLNWWIYNPTFHSDVVYLESFYFGSSLNYCFQKFEFTAGMKKSLLWRLFFLWEIYFRRKRTVLFIFFNGLAGKASATNCVCFFFLPDSATPFRDWLVFGCSRVRKWNRVKQTIFLSWESVGTPGLRPEKSSSQRIRSERMLKRIAEF